MGKMNLKSQINSFEWAEGLVKRYYLQKEFDFIGLEENFNFTK
jgi:hypothetical protein